MNRKQLSSRHGRAAVRVASLFLAAMLAGAGAACSRDSGASSSGPRVPTATGGDLPEVLATVDGQPITLQDVYARTGGELERMDLQYRLSRQKLVLAALDSLVRQRVLTNEAEARGRSVEDLIIAEAGSGMTPSPVEIEAWYTDNRGRLGGRSLDQVRDQIAEHLRNERRNEAVARLEKRLHEERAVAIHLEPIRVEFDNSRAPALGPENAPVTVVEFSDFQCPYCASLAPTIKDLEKEFNGQVRVVYRHFPLTTIHPLAFKAAEASMCAQDQGQFWAMHDMIFAEQSRVSVADLKEKAKRLGLNQRDFDSCLDSGRHAEIVLHDYEEGLQAGITGTPATFINGIQVEGGAVSLDVLAEAVRRELERRPGGSRSGGEARSD